MIDVAEAYKEIRDGKETVLDFECEHCNRKINDYGFNMSVFLYGAVFLVGKELGYIGITCPSCMYTVLLKGTDFSILQQNMGDFNGPNGILLHPQFNYHSSVLYSPGQINHLDSIDISTWNCPININSNEQFNAELSAIYEGYEVAGKNYLCSYAAGGDAPIGVFASVWWYRPDDVEKLVQIENEHRIRVFPRYVHKMTWFERYDYFCWRYKLYQDYLAGMKQPASISDYQLREYAYQEDINLDRLKEANPDFTTERMIEFLQEQAQQVASNDIQAASEFLDLLVNFNPDPWDVPGAMSGFYKGIWKSVKPFQGASLPADVKDMDPEKYNPSVSDASVKEMTDGIRSFITKSHVQDWAGENHQDFIKEYIALARRPDFSYGDVWALKCRYLQQLHGILEKAPTKEQRYAFYATGPTWTIIYDSREIAGLKGNGFRYIEFLLKNQDKQYHTNELNEIDAKAKNTGKFLEKDALDDMKGSDTHIKTDSRAKSQYEARIKELQEEISEAERNNDLEASTKASEEYEGILSQLSRDFTPSGNPRNFRDDSDKIKDRIVQAIRRAIQTIKKHDPEIAKHFNDAFKPINTFQQCYNPHKDINWQFME